MHVKTGLTERTWVEGKKKKTKKKKKKKKT